MCTLTPVAFSLDDGFAQSTAEYAILSVQDPYLDVKVALADRDNSGALPAEPTDVPNDSPAGSRAPRRHFPCFDGLRAAAAIAVLFLHVSFWSGFTARSGAGAYIGRLEIGVAVFFLISGFLLYRPFAVAHLAGRPAPSARRFWYRRLLRLVPAYWVALTIITFVLHDVTLGHGWQGAVANYGFAQIYLPSQIFNGITQAWSLCTEVSFYVFLPLYAAAIGFRRRSQAAQFQREIRGLVVLVLISFWFRNWTLHQPVSCAPNCLAHPAMVSLMSSWLPSYLDLFALGMFLAVLSAWFAERQSEPRFLRHPLLPWVSWTAALVTYWIVSHIGIASTPIYVVSPGVNLLKQSLYGVFAFFLILPAVFGPQDQGVIRRLLQARLAVALGVISYGIYLWHQAFVSEFLRWTNAKPFEVPILVMAAAVFALSVVAASSSYVIFEIPALNLKDKTFRLRPARAAQPRRVARPTPVVAPALEAGASPADSKLAGLVVLSSLHQAGELTDAEYQRLKAEVIDSPDAPGLSPQRQLGPGDINPQRS
jgi:peptidoglycan/LPS O-acetylase OafA/YrhL